MKFHIYEGTNQVQIIEFIEVNQVNEQVADRKLHIVKLYGTGTEVQTAIYGCICSNFHYIWMQGWI